MPGYTTFQQAPSFLNQSVVLVNYESGNGPAGNGFVLIDARTGQVRLNQKFKDDEYCVKYMSTSDSMYLVRWDDNLSTSLLRLSGEKSFDPRAPVASYSYWTKELSYGCNSLITGRHRDLLFLSADTGELVSVDPITLKLSLSGTVSWAQDFKFSLVQPDEKLALALTNDGWPAQYNANLTILRSTNGVPKITPLADPLQAHRAAERYL